MTGLVLTIETAEVCVLCSVLYTPECCQTVGLVLGTHMPSSARPGLALNVSGLGGGTTMRATAVLMMRRLTTENFVLLKCAEISAVTICADACAHQGSEMHS